MNKYRFAIVDTKNNLIKYDTFVEKYDHFPDPFDESYFNQIELTDTNRSLLDKLKQDNFITIGCKLAENGSVNYLIVKRLTDEEISNIDNDISEIQKIRLQKINKSLDCFTKTHTEIIDKYNNLLIEKKSIIESIIEKETKKL